MPVIHRHYPNHYHYGYRPIYHRPVYYRPVYVAPRPVIVAAPYHYSWYHPYYTVGDSSFPMYGIYIICSIVVVIIIVVLIFVCIGCCRSRPAYVSDPHEPYFVNPTYVDPYYPDPYYPETYNYAYPVGDPPPAYSEPPPPQYTETDVQKKSASSQSKIVKSESSKTSGPKSASSAQSGSKTDVQPKK